MVAGKSGRTADVFQPMDGTVRAKVALASKAEMRAAVENAKAAQLGWAAVNPQRRARVLMKFIDLIAKNNDELADTLAREHGKTIADAKGDIQRGVEVVEFALGVPHLMKGEYTDGAGPGIDLYSMRQPLGVVAGITPFNFPAMIPLWKLAPAIACGNAFILKPSERDPGVPMRLGELFVEAGGPPGILNVVNGDKEAVDAILDDPDIQAIGFVGSTPIAEYIYSRGTATGKRVQCFGGAKNHMVVMPDADMDQTVDALIGAGYGSAGERCMAVSVAVPVGQKTADDLMRRLIPRVESLKIGPSTDSGADYGPLVTKAALEKVRGYVDIGVKEGAKLVVDGRDFKMQGYENGFYMGGCLFDNVTKDMRIYKEEIFGPVLSVVRAHDYGEALGLCNDHEYGNGVAIFTRDGDAARDFASKVKVGMIGVNVPIPGAGRLLYVRRLEALGLRRSQPAWAGFDPLLHPHQDRDRPLAVRHQGRGAVLDPDDELRGLDDGGSGAYAGSRPVFSAGSREALMSTALKLMTVEEFLPWAEGKEGRWELHDGVPVMMSPERSLHAETNRAHTSRCRTLWPRRVCRAEFLQTAWRSRSTRGRHTNPTLRLSVALAAPPTLSRSTIPSSWSKSSPPARRDRPWPQAQRLFLAPERAALSDPRSRPARRHSSQARRGDAIETRVLTDGVARLDPPGFEVAVEALFPPA